MIEIYKINPAPGRIGPNREHPALISKSRISPGRKEADPSESLREDDGPRICCRGKHAANQGDLILTAEKNPPLRFESCLKIYRPRQQYRQRSSSGRPMA